jgi:hypothetical protein
MENCEKCGEAYNIGDWPFCPHGSIRRGNAFQAYPYKTRNLTADGSEVEVTSGAHERSLMQQYERDTGNKLVKRDDAAWIGATYEGHDMYNDRQVYSEGSGRGMPGQWY